MHTSKRIRNEICAQTTDAQIKGTRRSTNPSSDSHPFAAKLKTENIHEHFLQRNFKNNAMKDNAEVQNNEIAHSHFYLDDSSSQAIVHTVHDNATQLAKNNHIRNTVKRRRKNSGYDLIFFRWRFVPQIKSINLILVILMILI